MSEPLAIPVLSGPTITLRPHTMADLTPVLERCTDPDTIRWTTVPSPYTEDMGREYLARIMEPSSGQISWAIERDGAYAGTIDLRAWTLEPGHSSGNLGFVTHPAARGRGVMSEAVALVVRHAFEELGWELVAWQANVGNVASYKAAWRCGFPVPVLVPALLHHKGRMLDGWHSVLEPDMRREPVVAWEAAYAVLQDHVRQAHRPG
ncbi:MAG TPA: GNAT family N-acetyltransferase [Pedococcus sp.]|jgi:RimJ/RimL family protein N-acetyltransferase|nr:GNAT family N-acetyltransferase [Pedococcus sp.]